MAMAEQMPPKERSRRKRSATQKKDGRDVDRIGNHSSCPGKTGTDARGASGDPARLQETEDAISHYRRL